MWGRGMRSWARWVMGRGLNETLRSVRGWESLEMSANGDKGRTQRGDLARWRRRSGRA